MNPKQLVAKIKEAVKNNQIELIGSFFGVQIKDGRWVCKEGKKCCALSSLLIGEKSPTSICFGNDKMEFLAKKFGISEADLWNFARGFDMARATKQLYEYYKTSKFFMAGFNYGREIFK